MLARGLQGSRQALMEGPEAQRQNSNSRSEGHWELDETFVILVFELKKSLGVGRSLTSSLFE